MHRGNNNDQLLQQQRRQQQISDNQFRLLQQYGAGAGGIPGGGIPGLGATHTDAREGGTNEAPARSRRR